MLLDLRKVSVLIPMDELCETTYQSPGRFYYLYFEQDSVAPLEETEKALPRFCTIKPQTHCSITLYLRSCMPGMTFSFIPLRERVVFPFGVEKHMTSLQPTTVVSVAHFFRRMCFGDIRHLIDCTRTILVFANRLNVMHTENPAVSLSCDSDGTY